MNKLQMAGCLLGVAWAFGAGAGEAVYSNAASRETAYDHLKTLGPHIAKADLVFERDVPYYPADCAVDAATREKCHLDFYHPRTVKGFRTLVWLHSGGLDHGTRHWVPLADTNIAQVTVSYRLLGHEAKGGADCIADAAAAVAWTMKRVKELGGDPARVYVAGHSAGAYLSMMLALDPRWLATWGIKNTDLAGIVPISGQTTAHYNIRHYAGDNDHMLQAKIDDLTPLRHVSKDAPAILSICGQPPWEWPARSEENRLLIGTLKAMGHPNARFVEIPFGDHARAYTCGLPFLELFMRDGLPPDLKK